MRIKGIYIKGLFNLFDYVITVENSENVLIITGPNGFGKTMILNIIFNLFGRRLLFFYRLSFTTITITLSEGVIIVISKSNAEEKQQVDIMFFENGRQIESYNYSTKLETDIERNIQKYLPIRKYSSDNWIDHRSGKILSTEELINIYADELPESAIRTILRITNPRVNEILDSLQVHLIREQRLLKKIIPSSERNQREDKDQSIMIESIQTYAKELKQIILQFSQESFTQTQNLDSSYPDRLINETNKLTEEEYKDKFNQLREKQEKLRNFGLYDSKQKFLAYSVDDAKALSVYIKDFEKKLSVFDSLLVKLELFTDILNERRFNFKTINISRENGFYFKTNSGDLLELNQLSSGEQHEVVLLYELIFNVNPNILVLIDEPEISLHVTWQKEFLNDLFKIIKIQNIQVIIATHSPSIINSRWDLVYNLEKRDKYEEN